MKLALLYRNTYTKKSVNKDKGHTDKIIKEQHYKDVKRTKKKSEDSRCEVNKDIVKAFSIL